MPQRPPRPLELERRADRLGTLEVLVHVRGLVRWRWRARLAGWLIRLADLVAPGNVDIVELRRHPSEDP